MLPGNIILAAITFSPKHIWQNHLVVAKSFRKQGCFVAQSEKHSAQEIIDYFMLVSCLQWEAATGITAPRTSFLTTRCTICGHCAPSFIPSYLSFLSTSVGSYLAQHPHHSSPTNTLEHKQSIKLS